MLKTYPQFMKGDRLSLKQHFTALRSKISLLYDNRLIWWKKTTKFWCLPLFLFDFVLFIFLLCIGWSFLYLLLPFVVGLPLIWMCSYYESFISSGRIKKALLSFIVNYTTDYTSVRCLCLTNYIFKWRDLEFELAYSLVPTLICKGKVVRRQECYILCIHFIPDTAHKSEIVDENDNLLDSFQEQWKAYCQGKESCKCLRIENGTLYAIIPVSEVKDETFTESIMEQIQYLMKRFNLTPICMSEYMAAEIRDWMKNNNQEAPKDIEVISIDVFLGKDGYYLFMAGSRIYDPNNPYKPTTVDFLPKERFLCLPMLTVSKSDWAEFQNLVKDVLMKEVPVMAKDEHSLFYNRAVTLTFGNDYSSIIKDK